ncbi:MAG: nucleoside deaminase [Methylobacterium sp.]
MSDHETFLREAIALARDNIQAGGTAYGSVIVRDGEVIARAANQVHATNDPTAHAESLALREAGRVLGRPKLEDCIVYASGRPCPMCHAAMRLAGIREAYFAFTAEEAEAHGAGSAGIYAELCLPPAEQPMQVRHRPPPGEAAPYADWAARRDRGAD